ncbi:MAG: hypothetical protein JSV23_09530 [Promethearchaeota archaeon]|nr:MAG: hypothetical protein JSV23_09530 [Candidatus Lokiarchaeota archaeon]
MNKYIYLIILYLLLVIPSFLFQIIALGAEGTEDLTYLIPVRSLIVDSAYNFFFSPLIMIILIQLFSVVLAVFFLKLHKAMKLNRYDYYILKETYVKLSYWSMAKRVLLLGFFAFSFGIFLSQIIPEDIIIAPSPSVTVITPYLKASTTSNFILPFIILIIEPIWLLRDSSIICSLKEEKRKKEKRYLPDIEGIYHYFQSNFSGYVGIGAIIAIIILMYGAIQTLNPELGELADIPGILLTPFMLSVITLPALVFHELRLNTFRTKLVRKLTQKGIRSIEKIQEIA